MVQRIKAIATINYCCKGQLPRSNILVEIFMDWFISCVYTCACTSSYTPRVNNCPGKTKKAPEPPELELQVVLSHLIEMLGTKHRFSVTTVNAPHC